MCHSFDRRAVLACDPCGERRCSALLSLLLLLRLAAGEPAEGDREWLRTQMSRRRFALIDYSFMVQAKDYEKLMRTPKQERERQQTRNHVKITFSLCSLAADICAKVIVRRRGEEALRKSGNKRELFKQSQRCISLYRAPSRSDQRSEREPKGKKKKTVASASRSVFCVRSNSSLRF